MYRLLKEVFSLLGQSAYETGMKPLIETVWDVPPSRLGTVVLGRIGISFNMRAHFACL